MTLTVRVIAPDKIVWDHKAEEIILPSTTGQLGILTDHAPLLTALGMGVMRIREGKNWKSIALLGGFAEVENNEVKILVNGAELGDNIDKTQAGKEFEETQRKLDVANQSGDRQKQIQAENAMKRARVRYQAAGGVVAL
jgi:F-type H+-transporting ATPase subunit epsilon